jgi:hypothetical protein
LPGDPEKIKEGIRADAAEHVEAGLPPQTSAEESKFHDSGLRSVEIGSTYDDEYRRLSALKPDLKTLFLHTGAVKRALEFAKQHPVLGYVLALLALLIAILRDLLTKLITGAFESVGRAVYRRLAGNHFLRRVALRHYREAVKSRYERIHVPFRPGRPLDMRTVYVPVRVGGTVHSEYIDVLSAVQGHRSVVILGGPGSGKSMLMKHLMFAYSLGGLRISSWRPIPILLELHKLSNSPRSIQDHLIEEFELHDFPHAGAFVAAALKTGSLLLLFDGLDEVSSAQREIVVRDVAEFLTTHSNCRALVTCRSAVYRNDFLEVADAILQVAEFGDSEILQFLESWKSAMPATKSVEQLMQTLYDRPSIMALARNPLLLTIIATLYSDTSAVLPHSRAEFYRQATDLLLGPWHQSSNRFEARDKRLVLQRLALSSQDSSRARGDDRLSIRFEDALKLVSETLPRLNLQPQQDARPLLREVVERSGLILEIDSGQAYQFAHLTLQEYFAAVELSDDADGLISRFRQDPDTWRETVKLWCGIARESTVLVRNVYAVDPLTALECLADAQAVEPELVSLILETMESTFLADSNENLIRAFASVASDMRPRGRRAWSFLKEHLHGEDKRHSSSAAAALAMTNLPESAATLASLFVEHDYVRAALRGMGDVAVPELARLAKDGSSVEAILALKGIGTSKAVYALVRLLGASSEKIQTHAAWALAELLTRPLVERALRSFPADGIPPGAILEFIWRPFADPDGSPLVTIAGRIGWIICRGNEYPTTATTLDPRILLPILGVEMSRDLMDEVTATSENVRSRVRVLLDALPRDVGSELVRRLQSGPEPTLNDWLNVNKPLRYDRMTGIHFRLARFILATCMIPLVVVGPLLPMMLSIDRERARLYEERARLYEREFAIEQTIKHQADEPPDYRRAVELNYRMTAEREREFYTAFSGMLLLGLSGGLYLRLGTPPWERERARRVLWRMVLVVIMVLFMLGLPALSKRIRLSIFLPVREFFSGKPVSGWVIAAWVFGGYFTMAIIMGMVSAVSRLLAPASVQGALVAACVGAVLPIIVGGLLYQLGASHYRAAQNPLTGILTFAPKGENLVAALPSGHQHSAALAP